MVTLIVGAVVLVILIILLVIINVRAVQNQKRNTSKQSPAVSMEPNQQTEPEIRTSSVEHVQQHNHNQAKKADHAYRDALRTFSGQSSNPISSNENKNTYTNTSDMEYRRALRNIHKNKHDS